MTLVCINKNRFDRRRHWCLENLVFVPYSSDMNHLVQTLLGVVVVVLVLPESEESEPYSWADNVCFNGWYETTYTSYQRYRTRYQNYYAKCGLWGWGRCKRTRSWRSYYYVTRSTSVYKKNYYCCSGWRRSGRYCSTPICSRGCVHGRCTSPDTCTCNRGWTGYKCQYDINECSKYNGNCQQICINTPGSYRCGCKNGYQLRRYSSRYCEDKDECALNNGHCSHLCINTDRSYKCQCYLGYKLLPNRRSCLASNEIDFPINLVPSPTVTYSNDSTSKVEMLCTFDFPVWNNVSYLVQWYTNITNPVHNDTWCVPHGAQSNHSDNCSRRQSMITLSRHFVIGDTVWCKLYIKFSTSSKNNWTETGKESNHFYVGIEVSPRHVGMDAKECNIEKNITVILRPTVPILPFMNLAGTDSVVVSVLIPEKRQVFVDKCSVELKTKDISYGKTIAINGICDSKEKSHGYVFHFKPETSSLEWFSGVYQMPSLEVQLYSSPDGPFSEPYQKFCFCSMKNQVQKKEDCQDSETLLARINDNERSVMTQNLKNFFGSFDNDNP